VHNILAVDVEDWYHPEYVKNKVRSRTEHINRSFNIALDLIKEFDVTATFFVVGEIAERHPEILEKISENQHEIGFHGYFHEPLWALDADALRDEVKRFDSLISSVIGERCCGFRAPSYSLDNRTLWALDVLEEQGYVYDASLFPVKTPLYGVLGAPITPYHPSSSNITAEDEHQRLIEFPALVYPVMGLRIPAAGGFYLRLLPLQIFDRAIRKMNKKGFPAVLTIHPWELDDDTPRLGLGPFKSFVTYYNLKATKRKLKSILSRFEFVSFRDWIDKYGFA